MRRALIALVLTLSAAGAAQAQTLEDRMRSQLTATVTQLRALQADQATLTAQKTAAEQERDALKAKLAAAEAKLRARRAGPSQADLDKARSDQAAQDQVRLDAVTAQAQTLARTLDELRVEHDRTVQKATADAESLKTCRAKHADLTSLSQDLLAAYDRRSGAELLANREPFTGLARVKAQRRVQAYSDRLYAARLDARPKAPPPATPPSATATPAAPKP